MTGNNCVLPSYNVLTAGQIETINSNSFIVSHKKGEFLFSQDKPISYAMYLAAGLVKISKDDKNKSVILKIVGPGSYIGMFSVFYSNRYMVSATALEDSKLVYIGIDVFKQIVSENGNFALQILHNFSHEGMFLLDKLVNFPQKQIPGRIAEVLLFFSAEIYHSAEFTLPLSRQELANMVYSTKESVSRTLTEFKNDRMIDVEDRKVTLKSIDLLHILSTMG